MASHGALPAVYMTDRVFLFCKWFLKVIRKKINILGCPLPTPKKRNDINREFLWAKI